jgi:hypothetical protein
MKIIETIFIKRDRAKAVAKLKGKYPDELHIDQYIDKTRRIVAPDGHTTAMLLRGVIPEELYDPAFRLCWPHVKGLPSNRANAAGTPSMPRVKKDKTLAKRTGVSKPALSVLKKWGTRTGVLGFSSETRDRSLLTERHPEMLDRNRALFERVDRIYKKCQPLIYSVQQSAIEQAPNRRLWQTAFSSCYLAKKFQTGYHRDGNLNGVMTGLMVTGNFTGGELVIPRWGIAIVLRPGDLLLFDAEELHGNVEIEGDRLSFAFYCASIHKLLLICVAS